MAVFTVKITRRVVEFVDLEVEADSEAEAIEEAESEVFSGTITEWDYMSPPETAFSVIPSPTQLENEAARLRAAARAKHQRDGEVEIDEAAEVSVSDDGGAYVAAWVWVGNDDL